MYGAPLAQRDSYSARHSSLLGPDGMVNYDYIVTNSINCMIVGSICISNAVVPCFKKYQNLYSRLTLFKQLWGSALRVAFIVSSLPMFVL